jgi:hypothetical protein
MIGQTDIDIEWKKTPKRRTLRLQMFFWGVLTKKREKHGDKKQMGMSNKEELKESSVKMIKT